MRRKLALAAMAGGLSLGAGLVLFPNPSASAPPSSPAPVETARPAATQLPINHVVLFSSGVGYFQREGTVEGNTRVDLSFPVQDINDLLKSMVVRDLDGGVISTVNYDSNAPVEKTLKSYALNLNGDPSFGQILNQARGEKVEAPTRASSSAT